MHISNFTERPYIGVPEDEIIMNDSFFGVSNKFMDPKIAAELHNRYFDEKLFMEEVGFDGVMLNEHHGTPFCMGSVMNVEAAILARITKKMKIALMGNPLPVADPLRLAEELAEIDMISRGRLISGWVRGAGSEQLANNINPAHNRERFNEAHDFIQQAWTKDGPWRYEGNHYHYRHVNPWAKPYDGVPECWIPGLVSPETVVWTAQQKYTYLALGTFLDASVELWNLYADNAAEAGWQAGPECFGYLQRVFVADTEEIAQEIGKAWLHGGGQSKFARPEWMFPPGYNTKAANQRLARIFMDPEHNAIMPGTDAAGGNIHVEEARRRTMETYEPLQELGQIMVGTPKTVLPRIRNIMETLRPGVFVIFQIEGPVSHEMSMRSIELLGKEVLPQMREWAKELDLPGPDEVKPGSRKLPANGIRDAVVNLSSVAAQ